MNMWAGPNTWLHRLSCNTVWPAVMTNIVLNQAGFIFEECAVTKLKFGNPFSLSTSSMPSCRHPLLSRVTGSTHSCLLGLPPMIFELRISRSRIKPVLNVSRSYLTLKSTYACSLKIRPSLLIQECKRTKSWARKGRWSRQCCASPVFCWFLSLREVSEEWSCVSFFWWEELQWHETRFPMPRDF